MSRCECCNNILTPQESVRRFKDSGAFTNSCSKCLRDIGVATKEGHVFRSGYTEIDEDEDMGYAVGGCDRDDHLPINSFKDFDEEDDG